VAIGNVLMSGESSIKGLDLQFEEVSNSTGMEIHMYA
jgi:hypothetical protein